MESVDGISDGKAVVCIILVIEETMEVIDGI